MRFTTIIRGSTPRQTRLFPLLKMLNFTLPNSRSLLISFKHNFSSYEIITLIHDFSSSLFTLSSYEILFAHNDRILS